MNVNVPAPAAAEPIAATAATPVPQPPVAPAAQPPVAEPAAATPAPTPVLGTGTSDDPIRLPAGSTEKVAELFKSKNVEAIEKFISEQPEAARAKLKELFEGGDVTVADAEAAAIVDQQQGDEEFSPFTEEELSKLDPAVAKRIAMAQDELLKTLEMAEAPRIPDAVKKLLEDPIVRRRNEELESGTVTPLAFNVQAFNGALLKAIEEGDKDGIQAILAVLPEAVEEVARQHADLRELELQNEIAEREAFKDRKLYFKSGIEQAFAHVPELDPHGVSPYKIDNLGNPVVVNGAVQLNPEHPGNQFVAWVQGMNLTAEAIEQMGGMKELAMLWVAKSKGGFGNIVAQRTEATKQTMLEKLRSSRTAAQRQITAAPVTGAQIQTSASAVHGVDIARAAVDRNYASVAIAGLDAKQTKEVAEATRRYLIER